MTTGVIIGCILLALEVGLIFGWSLSEYRHAGKELKRIRQTYKSE